MANPKKATATATPAEGLRRCIGSLKFGIAAHDASVADFPVQPSQKDGLGRLCKPHWAEYTRALRKAALARQPAPAAVAEMEPVTADEVEAKASKTDRAKAKPAAKPTTKSAANRAGKPSHKAAQPAAPTAEVPPSDIEPEAAEQDAILVERKTRVKAWRKSELQGTPVGEA